ncbi:hypothetical protein [Clostridium felsineum]|uniref:hypothetical protein n=1 Tax=Clostridium felsineum TaxID=36839 RepID=UPI001590A5C4|nr:hypothetical protein [Clostridium felsineum]
MQNLTLGFQTENINREGIQRSSYKGNVVEGSTTITKLSKLQDEISKLIEE